jgi:hypothetical protein
MPPSLPLRANRHKDEIQVSLEYGHLAYRAPRVSESPQHIIVHVGHQDDAMQLAFFVFKQRGLPFMAVPRHGSKAMKQAKPVAQFQRDDLGHQPYVAHAGNGCQMWRVDVPGRCQRPHGVPGPFAGVVGQQPAFHSGIKQRERRKHAGLILLLKGIAPGTAVKGV